MGYTKYRLYLLWAVLTFILVVKVGEFMNAGEA